MDKKTLALLVGLALMFGFFYFISRTVDIKQFINFGDYTSNPEASKSGRTSFSNLIATPTPTTSL